MKQEITNLATRVRAAGQSVWIEGYSRSLVEDGQLEVLRHEGVAGAMADLAAVAGALQAGDDLYDIDLGRLGTARGPVAAAWELLEEDVRRAADVMRPTYEVTAGQDGYVGIGISPLLASDTRRAIAAARQLWRECDRPNVVIGVPATEAGLPAICRLVADGINVNAGPVFTVARYLEVADAVLTGLEVRREGGADLTQPATVVGLAVGPLDAAVDALIRQRLDRESSAERRARLDALRGKVAVASARLAYRESQRLQAGPRWRRLRKEGARPLRCLWSSIAFEGAGCRPATYLEQLLGPGTVVAMPLATYRSLEGADLDRPRLESGLEESVAVLAELSELGIDLNRVGRELETGALAGLLASHRDLIGAVEARLGALERDSVREAGEGSFPASDPGPWSGAVLGGPPQDP